MQKTTSKNLLFFVLIAVLASVLVWAIVRGQPADNATAENNGDATSALSLYYRADCPHCQNVEKFMLENNVAEKIKVEMKEAASNVKNNNELMARAANCGLDLKLVGVPLLYDRGTCYVGDEEIINYFQSRL